jgi:Uma2 family endonuclease
VRTEHEYLDIERRTDRRNEYLAGIVRPKPASNRRHNLIVGGMYTAISSQLRDRECEAYAVAMRVRVAPTRTYLYPDIVAVCGEPRFEDAQVDTLLNPTVIVEVLSESTEAYDRGEKFAQYRRLESLREYVLVAQNRVRIEHYRREDEQWVLSEISDESGTLDLPSIDCRVSVGAVYEKVDFGLVATTGE